LKTWTRCSLSNFEVYMNGLPTRLNIELRQRHSLRELVWGYLVSGNRAWDMDLMKLSSDEKELFNIGILSIVEEAPGNSVVSFTSGLIYRMCICSTFPQRNIRLRSVLPPISLLQKALGFLRPSQLGIRKTWNVRNPSEHMFQLELYSVLTDLLPYGWKCGSEAHPQQGESKFRMDLLLLTSSDSNEFGIELKVDHIKDKLETAIKKAKDYTEEFEVDVYLVNFLSKLLAPPVPRIVKHRSRCVYVVNITYNDQLNKFDGKYLENNGIGKESEFHIRPQGDKHEDYEQLSNMIYP
jgi:hypothetical protein